MTRLLVFALFTGALGRAGETARAVPAGEIALWRTPHSMTASDWVWGPGGERGAPVPPFQFVKENTGGTNPKVEVRDARGSSWTVKFGAEVHSDVFTSRLLYALGYAAEPAYYVAEGVIEGARDLHRARPYIAKDGQFRRARFKLRDRGLKYADEYQWSWTENPFLRTHELNGLRILMMLVSNWDAKDARDGDGSNTAVFRVRGGEPPVYLYAMTDWGASFGSWGGFFQRDRWDPAAYERQTPHFVKGVKDGCIVWGYDGKHGRDITAGITADDVRWLLPYLSAIGDDQLRFGLLASGASPAAAERFGRAIRDRIEQLRQIAGSDIAESGRVLAGARN